MLNCEIEAQKLVVKGDLALCRAGYSGFRESDLTRKLQDLETQEQGGDEQVTQNGSVLEYDYFPMRSLAYYQMKLVNRGDWKKIRTKFDSENFGLFCHPKENKLMLFRKGTEIVAVCQDKKSLKSEIETVLLFRNFFI